MGRVDAVDGLVEFEGINVVLYLLRGGSFFVGLVCGFKERTNVGTAYRMCRRYAACVKLYYCISRAIFNVVYGSTAVNNDMYFIVTFEFIQ